MDKDVQKLVSRGVSEIIDKDHLEKRLHSSEKLRVKLGIDPTSPDIHIGRAVLLWKLRSFQELGHTAVFIIGDFTGVVGDTSDKESERPMLSQNEVKSNMESYFDQAFRILDKDKTEVHYNSEWLSNLGFQEIAVMANQFGLNDFVSREVIAKRMDAGQRVSLHETLYPLMQGYDSVAVRADVEIGGTDQRFNLLTGRKVQPLYNQRPQDILMVHLLEGIDGRKMSSSWGNVINLTDSANDMYGKVMSLKDELIQQYFELATRLDLSEIEKIIRSHPKEAKMRLAREIVSLYHGENEAIRAEEGFEQAFARGGIPSDVKILKLEGSLAETLVKHGVVSSKSEFARLYDAGAIKEIENGVYRIGKHRFIKILSD